MGEKEVALAVYVITFIFGLPANILALYTFIKKAQQRATPVDILLIGLTLSDLLFLLFLPIWIKEAVDNMEWHMPKFLCPLSVLIFYGTFYNSTLYLTAISVERYLGVAFPIKYKLKRKLWYAMVGSTIIWAISLIQCSIGYVVQYRFDNETSNEIICYDSFSSGQLKVLLPFRLQQFILLFCAPLCICCFCYINFICILSQLPNICARRRHRAIGLAIGTIVIFVVCFGPYNVSHLVGFITNESPKWRKHAVLTSTFNACLDPFIYYLSSSTVRATFWTILRRLSAGHCFSSNRAVHKMGKPVATEEHTKSTNNALG